VLVTEPIVFISRNRIKPGRADELRKHYQDSTQPTMDGKTGTIAQLCYENGDGTEFTVVRIFASAEAFDEQLRGAEARSSRTYEFAEPIGIEILGKPRPTTVGKLKRIAGTSISLSSMPVFLGGFLRQTQGWIWRADGRTT
jgi:quinol monooxygenase YgiN